MFNALVVKNAEFNSCVSRLATLVNSDWEKEVRISEDTAYDFDFLFSTTSCFSVQTIHIFAIVLVHIFAIFQPGFAALEHLAGLGSSDRTGVFWEIS